MDVVDPLDALCNRVCAENVGAFCGVCEDHFAGLSLSADDDSPTEGDCADGDAGRLALCVEQHAVLEEEEPLVPVAEHGG